MFEAVGEKYWPVYFNTIKKSLKSGGLGCLQVITIDDKYFPHYRKSVDFLQKYIFPGGMLPSYSALIEQIRNADLEFIKTEFGQVIRRRYAFGPGFNKNGIIFLS